jgi:hypothetical protein
MSKRITITVELSDAEWEKGAGNAVSRSLIGLSQQLWEEAFPFLIPHRYNYNGRYRGTYVASNTSDSDIVSSWQEARPQ